MFEHYCLETKAGAFDLEKFYNDADQTNVKLSFRNFMLDDQTAKAVALILPYMHEVKEFEAYSNKMSDQISGALLFAVFLNPSITKISFGYNYLRGCFC